MPDFTGGRKDKTGKAFCNELRAAGFKRCMWFTGNGMPGRNVGILIYAGKFHIFML